MPAGESSPDLEPADLDPAALARAEAALARLSARYLHWAEADLRALEACLADARAEPERVRDHMARLFQTAHNMKGQAATFGYPLITELGRRLCRAIECETDPGPAAIERLARLVGAIATVLTERLRGDGGEAGRRIINELES